MRRTKDGEQRPRAECPCGERAHLEIKDYRSSRDRQYIEFKYKCLACGKKFKHYKKYTDLGPRRSRT